MNQMIDTIERFRKNGEKESLLKVMELVNDVLHYKEGRIVKDRKFVTEDELLEFDVDNSNPKYDNERFMMDFIVRLAKEQLYQDGK